MADPILNLNNMPEIWKFLLEIGKLFVGAFSGAFCAFKFERRKRKIEDKERKFAASKYAQFTLITQLNTITVLRKQKLSTHKNNPNRWSELLPIHIEDNAPRLQLDYLTFLLETKKPNLLLQITLNQEQYTSIINVVKERNSFHLSFQKSMAVGQIDQQVSHVLKDLTDSLYNIVDDAISEYVKNIFTLTEVMLQEFPDQKPLYLNIEAMKENGFL